MFISYHHNSIYLFIYLALDFMHILLFSLICFHVGFLDKILSQVVEILTRNWREAVVGRLSHLLSRWFQASYLIDAHLHKLEASLCSNNFTAFLRKLYDSLWFF